jgi:3-oxoacyl-[acyl-carrier protein] reductase
METAESVANAFSLRGRSAVVTGAGSGIGRSTAEVLAGAGAAVCCVDVDGDAAEETAAAIRGTGGEAEAAAVDVADASAVHALIDSVVAHRGSVDVMCNIAGTMAEAKILDVEESVLDRLLAVNFKGVLNGCQAAGRAMVERGGGSIVNMASTAVLAPTPDVGPYAITKAAVVQLTRTMAVEVGRKGVRVNAVAPGFVPTNMTARYYRRPDGSIDDEMRDAVLGPMAKFAPLRRVGETTDIAYCVLFLASDASSFMTGQLLSPNGGVAMH